MELALYLPAGIHSVFLLPLACRCPRPRNTASRGAAGGRRAGGPRRPQVRPSLPLLRLLPAALHEPL